MSNISGNISDDDIEVYQSSGEEWISTVEKKRTTRRTSQRLRKKPRISVDSSDDSEIENEKIEIRNKKKISKPPQHNNVSSRRVPYKAGTEIVNKDFGPGGFLVQKKDVQIGDASKPPCLWRIDGKALLQKYEVIEDQGKMLHRSTSIYTGWSSLDKDLYSPVTVRVQWHTSQQMTVELDWETLKNATLDSD